MPRDQQHFVLSGFGNGRKFKRRGGGSKKRPRDVLSRTEHAQRLLRALDELPQIGDAPGLYLNVVGRAGQVMVGSGLNASGLELLKIEQVPSDSKASPRATVFASPEGLANLRRKVEAFETEDTKMGRPQNADLVQSINALVEAGLRELWRSPPQQYPVGDESS